MKRAAVATPRGRHVELVNGGFGIKHPLLRHSDVNDRNIINTQQLGQPDTLTCRLKENSCTFNALTLLVGHQEEHPACKN